MSGGHTPGPWEAFKGVEQGDEMRCGVSAMRGKVGYLVATIENGAPGDFCDTEFANARLIAAAPDLLDAAVKAEALLTSLTAQAKSEPGGALKDLRAAIAKVRGAQ